MNLDSSTPNKMFMPPPEWVRMSNTELAELRSKLENVILKTPDASKSLLTHYQKLLRQLENYIQSRTPLQSKDHVL